MSARILDGRYRLERKLGKGGMAHIFLATDLKLQQYVAIKIFIIQHGQADETRLADRFQREFQACSSISHPNIIRLYSFGEIKEGGYYYAMEYLPHPDLSSLVQSRRPLEQSRVLVLSRQMISAFKRMHAKGIIHRDIKPGNIIAADDDRFVLTDFGLARDFSRSTMTRSGTVLGTPCYMAPEQAQGKRADFRCDYYQLGIVLYEVLTGQRAFDGGSLEELMEKIFGAYPTAPNIVNPALLPGWDGFILNLIDKSPDNRYQDPDRMLADLEDLAIGKNVKALAQRSPKAALSPARSGTAKNPPEQPVRKPRKRRPARRDFATTIIIMARRRLLSVLTLACIAAALIIAVVGLSRWAPGGRGLYTIKSTKTTTFVDLAVVEWQSNKAYPSRVILEDTVLRVFEGDAGSDVRRHRVLVNGLEEGRIYSFRILFPTGKTSLPQKVKTRRLSIDICKIESAGKGLTLVWKSNPPLNGWLRIKSAGRDVPAAYRAVSGKDGTSRVSLASLPENCVSAEIVLQTPGCARKTTDLAPLLRRRVNDICSRLGTVHPLPLIKEINIEISSEVSQMIDQLQRPRKQNQAVRKKKLKEQAERLQKLVYDRDLYETYIEGTAIAPLVFDTRLFDFSLQALLYRQLTRYYSIFVYAAFNHLSLPCPPRARPRHWAGSSTLMNNISKSIALRSPSAKPLDMGLHRPRIGLFGTSSKSFVFSLDKADGISAAQLEISCNRLVDLVLWIQVNNKVPLMFEEHFHKRDDEYRIFQRIPPPLFRNGRNIVKLYVDPLFSRLTRSRCRIKSLTLHLSLQ